MKPIDRRLKQVSEQIERIDSRIEKLDSEISTYREGIDSKRYHSERHKKTFLNRIAKLSAMADALVNRKFTLEVERQIINTFKQ